MATPIKNKLIWHYETMPRATKQALDFLSRQSWLEKSGWYLAGGTALALQTGHRKSLDLDFFTTAKNFNPQKLLTHFLGNSAWQTGFIEEGTIFGELFKSKVSFLAYPFFEPKRKELWHGSVRVLHKLDLAVMKVTAISQRGRKRDFFDLYWCAINIDSLENIIRLTKTQYTANGDSYHHVLKSLVYFEDAEDDPEPEIYFKARWPEVKSFFKTEVTRIARRFL